MEAEPLKADPPKRKRRWLQFSLRTLLIFTLVCAIPCAWLGRKIEQKRRQRAAVKAIKELGGSAVYERLSDGGHIGPAWVRQLFGDDFFSDVFCVSFADGHIDDAQLTVLNDLSHIVILDLSEQGVSDVGISSFGHFTDLKNLDLSDTRISDAGLSSLKPLAQLEVLHLERTNVTDAGVNELQKALPNCQIDH